MRFDSIRFEDSEQYEDFEESAQRRHIPASSNELKPTYPHHSAFPGIQNFRRGIKIVRRIRIEQMELQIYGFKPDSSLPASIDAP